MSKCLFFFTGVEMDYTLHRVLPLDGEALGTNKHLCWTSYKNEFVKCFYPSFKNPVNCSRKCLTKKNCYGKDSAFKKMKFNLLTNQSFVIPCYLTWVFLHQGQRYDNDQYLTFASRLFQ